MEQIKKAISKRQIQAARLISRLTEPVFWLPLMIWIVLRHINLPAEKQFIFYFPLLLFVFVIPFSYFMYLVYVKKEVDIDITQRTKRIALTSRSMVSFALALPITYFISGKLFEITVAVFLATLGLVLVTLRWKISFHGGLNTLIFCTINYLYNWRLWWLFLLLVPIGWARLIMKKHDPAQLAAGILLSAVIFLLVTKIL